MLQFLKLSYTKNFWLTNQYFLCLLTFLIVGYAFPTIALEEKSQANNEWESLQTEITQNDFKIIEQLVKIAESQSPQVLEAKNAMGWQAFQDVVSVEISPSITTTNYDSSAERENSFYVSFSLDPVKLISAFEQKPLMRSRWNEAKQQKRLAVIKSYLAYIQARQTTKVAAYKMQHLTASDRIASVNSSNQSVNHLNNPEYIAAATGMLNANAQEQIALQELAACVGLPTPEILPILNRH